MADIKYPLVAIIWTVCFLSGGRIDAAPFDPDTYETEIRKQARIPDDWLVCKSDKDCVIASVPCQTGIAVARQHKADAEGAVCHAEDCNQMCNGTHIVKSYTDCDDDMCVLRAGIRPPPPIDEDKPTTKKSEVKKSDQDDAGDKIDPRDIP